MQIRQMPVRWRGQDKGDGGAWGDERQVAVWGQVSARTLYLVVIAMRFLATWSRRRELRSHDAPDDAVDAPDC